MDFDKKKELEIKRHLDDADRVIEICNGSLMASINCTNDNVNRCPENCNLCGNEDCIDADVELSALWAAKDEMFK